MKRDIDAIINGGYKQMSRKYRILARTPPGKTPIEALAEVDPEAADRLIKDAIEMLNDRAHSQYCQRHARDHGDNYLELTVAEFAEYLHKTGRSNGWTPTGEPCESCYSYGDNHSRSCLKVRC